MIDWLGTREKNNCDNLFPTQAVEDGTNVNNEEDGKMNPGEEKGNEGANPGNEGEEKVNEGEEKVDKRSEDEAEKEDADDRLIGEA